MSKLGRYAALAASLLLLFVGTGLAIATGSYIQFTCPAQPDLASGHVVAMSLGHHLFYATRLENMTYDGSFLVIGIGMIGRFWYLFVTRKRRKPASFG